MTVFAACAIDGAMSSAAVIDSYEYDAYGNNWTLDGTTTPNNMFYRGEEYDSDLSLYYLRARYYNLVTGRFMSRDPENGITTDPKTLHKYLYAGGDPVNAWDPTGKAPSQVKVFGGAIGEDLGLITALFAALETAKTVAGHPASVANAIHELGEGVNCMNEYIACALTSLADEPGSVHGESACRSCYRACLGSGSWPGSVPTTRGKISCDYSKF
jgi:RHS repeat-associated protein